MDSYNAIWNFASLRDQQARTWRHSLITATTCDPSVEAVKLESLHGSKKLGWQTMAGLSAYLQNSRFHSNDFISKKPVFCCWMVSHIISLFICTWLFSDPITKPAFRSSLSSEYDLKSLLDIKDESLTANAQIRFSINMNSSVMEFIQDRSSEANLTDWSWNWISTLISQTSQMKGERTYNWERHTCQTFK